MRLIILLLLLSGCARPIGEYNGKKIYIEKIKIISDPNCKKINGEIVCGRIKV